MVKEDENKEKIDAPIEHITSIIEDWKAGTSV